MKKPAAGNTPLVNYRMPLELREKLQKAADDDGRTLSNLLLKIATDWVAGKSASGAGDNVRTFAAELLQQLDKDLGELPRDTPPKAVLELVGRIRSALLAAAGR